MRTTFPTSHALRVVKQSADVWLHTQSNTYFAKFIGPMGRARKNDSGTGIIVSTSPNALCQLRMELGQKKGDKITFPLRSPLTSAGVVGDGDLEGNEEAMTFYDWSMTLKSIGHAVRGDGDLSDKRVQFNVESQAKEALTIWMGRVIDYYVLCALSGLASTDGNVAEAAPASDRKWVGGQTSAGVVSATANNRLSELTDNTSFLMGPKVIELMRRKAQMADPKIRPIRVGGNDHYVMFLHPYQVKALKATSDWPDIQKNAGLRGQTNPIFTGALGMWDGVVLHEWERLAWRLGAGGATATEYFNDSSYPAPNTRRVARALFCGAQAVCQAYGRQPRFVTKQFDYGRKWGVGTDCHITTGKPVFNSLDYGVITVDTVIVAD